MTNRNNNRRITSPQSLNAYVSNHRDIFLLTSDVEAFSMEFNGTEFVQSSEVVPGIDPADGAGTGAHS